MEQRDWVDLEALAESVRVTERLLDVQIEARESLYRRADGLDRTGIAAAGGIAAVTGFLLSQGEVDVWTGTLIASSMVLVLLGLFNVLNVSAGARGRRELAFGPDMDSIEKAVDDNLRIDAVLGATARANAASFRVNIDVLGSLDRTLGRGMYGLALGASAFFMVLLYIGGSHILG